MADKGPDLRKVATLLAALKDGHEKQTAIIDEINELLGGGAGIAALVKNFQTHFDYTWRQRYARGGPAQYVWRYAVDVPNIKRLIKLLGLDELSARAFNYLRNDDPFIARSRHPFGLFVSGINSYANAGSAPDLELDAPPSSCRHTPACRTEDACTRRRSAEMRA